MSATMTSLLIGVLAGAALGVAYFYLLYQTVKWQTSGGPAGLVWALLPLRLAGAGLVFWLLAQQGAAMLLAALMAFLVVRLAAQRKVREAG